MLTGRKASWVAAGVLAGAVLLGGWGDGPRASQEGPGTPQDGPAQHAPITTPEENPAWVCSTDAECAREAELGRQTRPGPLPEGMGSEGLPSGAFWEPDGRLRVDCDRHEILCDDEEA